MAVPRAFVSSTCYDLQEIRLQLRSFLQSLGAEPVMSEFGDIFYDFSEHVHDSCRSEIERCNVFVLVVGNSYGTVYHRHIDSSGIPDSVTLQEFRKALDISIPKYVFVNRFVQHDFDNYRRALDKEYARFFRSNEVPDDRIDESKRRVKKDFDASYHFPQDAYRYIFHFLEAIHAQKKNNAVTPFESFEDIKEALRKQWGGLVFETLTQGQNVSSEALDVLAAKLDAIEKQIRSLVTSKDVEPGATRKATFDLGELYKEFAAGELAELQERIASVLRTIRFYGNRKRMVFREKWGQEAALSWLAGLDAILKQFKWSTTISVTDVFRLSCDYVYWADRGEVPISAVLELSGIYQGFSEEDKNALAASVMVEFNRSYEKQKANDVSPEDEPPVYDGPPMMGAGYNNDAPPQDDVPF